ncbi:MAG: hypothetical protein H6732_11580 [Alphaproteobacteria bacterium]|nr:hypothetical protein [Alphaproteobacteria bacterium]
MTRLAALALLIAVGVACGHPSVLPADRPDGACDAGAFGAGPHLVGLEAGGVSRRALVWMPPGPGPHDVVVDLHEFRSDPERQQHYSGWLELAARTDAILVGPDGRSATWNAGPCCGRAQEKGVDDVAFLDAVIARLDAVACTSGRVLATGIGNGAMMAERWACASDVPDAVISVGGSLQLDTCERTRPIPWLHYHGALDDFAPPGGGEGRLPTTRGGGHLPVEHAVAAWRARNQATATTTDHHDGLACATSDGAAPTVSCVVDGMADLWPGAANAPTHPGHPLAHAARDGWRWVRDAWATAEAPTTP